MVAIDQDQRLVEMKAVPHWLTFTLPIAYTAESVCLCVCVEGTDWDCSRWVLTFGAGSARWGQGGSGHAQSAHICSNIRASKSHRKCVCVCTCYMLNNKILILLSKRGHLASPQLQSPV